MRNNSAYTRRMPAASLGVSRQDWIGFALFFSCFFFTASTALAALPLDEGDIIVAHGFTHVAQVDPATGNRINLDQSGTGPTFNSPRDVALEADGNILVIDPIGTPGFQRKLVRIDPVTGNRTFVSSLSVGTGPGFSEQNHTKTDHRGRRTTAQGERP